MVGKNNNYIRESKSNEHFQRFSLRKLSVGVVSVAVAAGFYLGSGTTAQAATTEPDTSAKTEQVVQQDATSAASDSASASNSSAAVSTSSATPVSAESASSAAVSDSPASASAASDNQASAVSTSENSSQPASSSVASDAASAVSEKSQAASEANSQSAADKQTAQLSTSAANVNESQAANIILSALVVQQAANQQAPAGFTVTDPTYPADMYKDTVASHYTYWWAQSSDGEYNLVLSTDRSGDGKVYVSLLDNNNNVYKYTVDKNNSVDVFAYYYYVGKVYNDGQSGVFISAHGTWKSKFNVFDPQVGKDDGNYGSISFMIPQVETQTTIYVNGEGNTVSIPITQEGLDGQIYTTQGGKVLTHYFAKEPKNAEGFMSPFGKQGATYVKDMHNGYKATFKETNTATGEMLVTVTDKYGVVVDRFNLKSGDTHYVEKANWNIHSIYIPQTINIEYVYEKLGNLIIESDSDAFPPLPPEYQTTSQYPNDKNDSTKADNVKIPEVPGFTPTINGMIKGKVKTYTLTDKDYNPADKSYTFNPADYVSDLSQDITVKYKADDQKATVKYIDDDNANKALKTESLSGKTNAKSGYTTAQDIQAYKDLGYVLVSDDTNGAEITFDNDDHKDQNFEVHLKHGTITVTPDKPGQPGTPINPGKGSASYPDGTDKAGLTDTVNRNITYKMSDGSKAPAAVNDQLSYTATKVIDKVTGKVIKTDWSQNQDFKDIPSPEQTGYTPDKTVVSNKDVAHDAQDINVVVTYTADNQKATVKYIDDDNANKALKTESLSGKTNAKSGYTTAQDIQAYKDLGYVLVSDDTNGVEITFDNDDHKDQNFEVHLKHGTITVTPDKPGQPGTPINPGKGSASYPDGTDKAGLTDTVNRNITYKMSDGSKAPAAVNDQLSYTATKVIDKVTGKVIKTDWSQNQDFKDIPSPEQTGYTPDKTVVSNKDVAHDAQDINVVVTYTADNQKATVKYIDDDNANKALKTESLSGKTNAKSGYTTAQDIQAYKDLGYVLVSDDTNGVEITFDNDDHKDQNFEVHLKHGTITVTPDKPGQPGTPINPGKGSASYPDGTDKAGLTDTVNRNITYKMSDGSKAPAAVNDQLSYTATKVIDKVTGKVIKTDWSQNQDFKDIPSPEQTGYTPDKTVVSNKDVAHDAQDINVVVTYTADNQKATVKYIDDDNANKALKTESLSGKTNAKSGYTTAQDIQAYKDLGYVLVSDDTNGVEITFDNDDHKDQNFEVHLKHGTITVTPDKPGQPGTPINPGKGSASYPDGTDKAGLTDTVNRNITYKMSDGSKAPAAVNDQLSYTATKVIDKVTGKVIKTDWSQNQDFKDIPSPEQTGYTPDKTVVSNKDVAHDAQDINVVVTYTADNQKATVKYIDDDNANKALKTESLSGKTNAKSGYTTAQDIQAYKDLGYVLVSDDTNGAEITFDNDDHKDQNFEVHLKHGTITVTPDKPGQPGTPINPGKGSASYPDGTDKAGLTDTVNRTITYRMSDGSKAPAAVNDQLSYTATKVIDKVTGKVIKTDWSQNQDFKDIPSPEQTGYTPDKTVVSNKDVAHDAQDINVVVTYTADNQKATVKYIDDDNANKALKTESLSGKTNAKSGYTTAQDIQAYKDLGYVLVSDDTNGVEITFDNDDHKDQNFEVHLKHGTITVTPDKPGQPGTPINPGKGSASYPDGTDKAGLTDTVNRTITYRMSDGSKAPAAVNDQLSYTATKVIDKVTGKVIKTDWSQNQDFKDIPSPEQTGYTPDKTVVSNKDVAHDAQDINVVVTYTADNQKATVKYIDDDNANKALKTESLSGKTNAKSGYTTAQDIQAYKDLGYVLVSDDTNGAEITFDNDDHKDQNFEVHLKHGTITVTPDNPKTPADVLPDNPGKNYPSGVAKDDLNKTVTRTINITTPDGKTQTITQKAEFTRSATVDEVTGEVTYGPWSKNVVLESVDVPNIPGYVPSASVPEITVTPNDQDMTINITYKKLDSGKATDQGGNASNGGQATNGGSTTGQSAQNGQSGQTQTNAGAQQLPQTGNANNEKGALGLAGALFAAGLGLGFGSKKKRHEN
nr:YSIRK-type signal peptide-containing protein [Limosilactobacillus mucosae]